MKDYAYLIWLALAGVAFAFAWRKGYLKDLSVYVEETREELRKCTWPSVEELKGSTAVVTITTILLGVFTIVVDQVFSKLITAIL